MIDAGVSTGALIDKDVATPQLVFFRGTMDAPCAREITIAIYCGRWEDKTGTVYVGDTLMSSSDATIEFYSLEPLIYHLGASFDLGGQVSALPDRTEAILRYGLQLGCIQAAVSWHNEAYQPTRARYDALLLLASQERPAPWDPQVMGRWAQRGIGAATFEHCNAWKAPGSWVSG